MNKKTINTNLGSVIFNDIDKNKYLNKLYNRILISYSLKKFGIKKCIDSNNNVNINDLLRFADLLSKSPKDTDKMWSQEIITLLNEVYPDNDMIKVYADSIFTNIGNYQAKNIIKNDIKWSNFLEIAYDEYQSNYLSVPLNPDLKFFIPQKNIYDHLSDKSFSYSGPTSMGKSFLMRTYMKEQILNGKKMNFAIVVPTRALINETSKKIIDEDLKEYLSKKNYKVVTSSNDIALEGDHNFIFVLTPERLLYLLISNEHINIDYLFIDEAHKISMINGRAPFYYKTVDMLNNRKYNTHFIFASPNIPNPEVYLKLLSNDMVSNKLYSSFSPVTQIKYVVDLNNKNISVYNDHTQEIIKFLNIKADFSTTNFLINFYNFNKQINNTQQNIVYFSGKNKAIKAAMEFSQVLHEIEDQELINLAKDIKENLHSDYYLGDLIKKGIAYHLGYLPASIRLRVEELFKKGKIHTMFCTSTLLEGVNLPADNLFIADVKISNKNMNAIDFRNLIGRVGRISFNLYGNVFLISEKNSVKNNYIRLLGEKVPNQHLSIEDEASILTPTDRLHIVNSLKQGKAEIKKIDGQTEEVYTMARKFGLILLKDILNDNDSLVKKEFSSYIDKNTIKQIKDNFANIKLKPDDDINISLDQTSNVIRAISDGLKYPSPDPIENRIMYESVLGFLLKLRKIFRWDVYEKDSLGLSKNVLKWYAVILTQWIEGQGVNYILNEALKYNASHPNNFYPSRYEKSRRYRDNLEDRNIIFSDTLEAIDNIILFKIANYFLRFSNEYKKYHNIKTFKNDWYEYIEYGTMNPLSILLQRTGFSREVSAYIKKHTNLYITTNDNNQLRLNKTILNAPNRNVREETKRIMFNMPEFFI